MTSIIREKGNGTHFCEQVLECFHKKQEVEITKKDGTVISGKVQQITHIDRENGLIWVTVSDDLKRSVEIDSISSFKVQATADHTKRTVKRTIFEMGTKPALGQIIRWFVNKDIVHFQDSKKQPLSSAIKEIKNIGSALKPLLFFESFHGGMKCDDIENFQVDSTDEILLPKSLYEIVTQDVRIICQSSIFIVDLAAISKSIPKIVNFLRNNEELGLELNLSTLMTDDQLKLLFGYLDGTVTLSETNDLSLCAVANQLRMNNESEIDVLYTVASRHLVHRMTTEHLEALKKTNVPENEKTLLDNFRSLVSEVLESSPEPLKKACQVQNNTLTIKPNTRTSTRAAIYLPHHQFKDVLRLVDLLGYNFNHLFIQNPMDGDLPAIFELIKGNLSITRLSIDWDISRLIKCTLTDECTTHLQKLITSLPNLKKLVIREQDFTLKGFSAILQILSHCSELDEVELDNLGYHARMDEYFRFLALDTLSSIPKKIIVTIKQMDNHTVETYTLVSRKANL